MDMYNRCCECGHKSHVKVIGGRVPNTEPCTECQSDRRNLQVGGDKPQWFDETTENFVARNKKPE